MRNMTVTKRSCVFHWLALAFSRHQVRGISDLLA
jgi:hypothetical protein